MTPATAAKQWIKRSVLRPWMTCAGARATGQVALTFDDGPHPEHTRRFLRVLDKHVAKATFFCVGTNLRRHPEIAAEILAAGHEISNHSMTHAKFAGLGYAEIAREFDEVFALEDDFGQPFTSSRYIRPPEGVINLGVLRYCAVRRVRIAYWNRDPRDYATHAADEMVGKFKDQPLVSGDIVLLHDDVPHGPQAVDQVLQMMQVASLKAVTVSTLLGTHATSTT